VQRRRVLRQGAGKTPSLETLINGARSDGVTQLIISLTRPVHVALEATARKTHMGLAEAAAGLVEEALVKRGYLQK
jgi:hypothetical protein